MKRLLSLFVPFAFVGCSSELSDAPQRAALKLKASEFLNAVREENHQHLLELTHPSLVQNVGGKEKFLELMRENAVEGKRLKLVIKDVEIAEPDSISYVKEEAYAIVPFKQHVSMPTGDELKSTYLIAASTDVGRTWVFITEAAVNNNRQIILTLLPNFPPDLKLPEKVGWEKKK